MSLATTDNVQPLLTEAEAKREDIDLDHSKLYPNQEERNVSIWLPHQGERDVTSYSSLYLYAGIYLHNSSSPDVVQSGQGPQHERITGDTFIRWLKLLIDETAPEGIKLLRDYRFELHSIPDPLSAKNGLIEHFNRSKLSYPYETSSGEILLRAPHFTEGATHPITPGHYELWFKSREAKGDDAYDEQYAVMNPPVIQAFIRQRSVSTGVTPQDKSEAMTPGGTVPQHRPRSSTEKRADNTRKAVRARDKGCVISGMPIVERKRGANVTGLHVAHIIPLFVYKDNASRAPEALQYMNKDIAQKIIKHELADLPHNAMVLRADIHHLFDDYQWGVWAGKVYRFEKSGAFSVGEIVQSKRKDIDFDYDARFKDSEGRFYEGGKEAATIFKAVLDDHFRTCLVWHVKGEGVRRKKELPQNTLNSQNTEFLAVPNA